MSRFRDEIRVIPALVWYLAVAAYLCSATLIFEYAIPQNPKLAQWPVEGQILFAYGLLLLVIPYILLIGYVCGDSMRRGMNCVLWTLLAIFIPNGIGIILYFLLRDPVRRPCPNCSKPTRGGTFCPHCGTPLQTLCPGCRRGIEPGWTHCAHCGIALPPSPSPVAP
ncbi:MAG TPA: zinc ribbon domain-containing protein [Candidatus Acidoferrales bacterium]|nr:zinc ribbon domain-containing protein [Candidatus Acidoferrales bacterium]